MWKENTYHHILICKDVNGQTPFPKLKKAGARIARVQASCRAMVMVSATCDSNSTSFPNLGSNPNLEGQGSPNQLIYRLFV